jgi:polysaccharide biosynthesis protein PelA
MGVNLPGRGGVAVRPREMGCLYADRAPAEDFRGYGLLVFDADRHPAVEPLTKGGALVLGYLSLGEVNRDRAWFGEDPNWPGSHYVDVRDAAWRKFVNARLVPEILAQGFRGVFLDSLDDPIELERRDPESREGMAGNALFTLLSLRLGFAW